jgi:uncharacterized protein
MNVRRFLYGATVLLTTSYVATCVYINVEQDHLTFPAPKILAHTTPASWGTPFEDLHIPVGSRDQIHAWWIPTPESNANALLFFHGNGYNMEMGRPPEPLMLHRLGVSLLVIDYRGYGSSSAAEADEKRVNEDAEAALRFVTQSRNIPENRIIIGGRSIGAAVAVNLAAGHPRAAKLILLSPFTNLTDASHQALWFTRLLPLDLIATHSAFRTDAIISKLHLPILLVAGTRDDQAPEWMARSLYESATAPKELYRVSGANHNDLWETGGDALIGKLASFVRGSNAN